jgi:uncharacterized lipoprotein YehR (DUF1307 family)
MKIKFNILAFILVIAIVGCKENSESTIFSPSKNIKVDFNLTKEGKPYYLVLKASEKVIDTSYLGFDFDNSIPFIDNFQIVKTSEREFNETWQMPW